MTIYKYKLEATDNQVINMPHGSKILTVQIQYDGPCLWALVDPKQSLTEDRKIRIHGTGHEVPGPDKLKYISTIQKAGGQLIFHVFEDLSE